MTASRIHASRRAWLAAFGWGLALLGGHAGAQASGGQALLDSFAQVHARMAKSGLGRPMVLESAETPNGLKGDVYAVVDHRLDDLRGALEKPEQWCELLTLHINNRRCRVGQAAGGGATLTLSVVRRYDKPVEEAFELPFSYRVASSTPDFLAVDMRTAEGPFGTSNYRVLLEAVRLDGERTFLHFGYGYEHNMMVKLATQAYLATFGAHKVGFTVTGRDETGQPVHITGLRGLVERNAMRYFLTLDAYLVGLDAP
ncbi:MAG: hypothetical protein REU00_21550, partial [Pseudomonadota bacterium]|nr:hypothetical protein [Pseudomonadota bacterium]